MLTAILVDDEYYALEGLKMELEDLGGVQIVGMYEEGKRAIENISILKPDIVFLDINMPEMNGLELFGKLLEMHPKVHMVFVTAYSDYAVEAFELNAVDYMIKPIRKERLKKTIERLQKENFPQRAREAVSINCFGHLAVKIDDQEADISWRTKKAQELLAYLACAEGDFISKEKIAEVLWPEFDMEKSKSNFYLAYHYLKKQLVQLGIAFPLESARGKIRLKVEYIELDFIKFKEEVTALKKITDDTIEHAEKIVQFYKGMLLEEHYYEWSMQQAQHYEMLYRELLEKITAYYKLKGNIEKQNYYLKKLENH